MYDAICLASGGLDSLTCLHLLRRQGFSPLPVFVNYGQINLLRELSALRENVRAHGFPDPVEVDISGFGRVIRTGLTAHEKRVLEDAFTPNRNLIFISVAASVAYTRAISMIVLGFLSERTAIFPDQTDRFISAAEAVLEESLGVTIRILCPLRDMVKSEVVSLAHSLGITNSYSCHSGGETPCGKCIACLEYEREG